MAHTIYVPPGLTPLGSLGELTLAPPGGQPPGKQGPSWDASQFQSNFSCVGPPGHPDDCRDNPASGPK